jgi:hypothetical protein
MIARFRVSSANRRSNRYTIRPNMPSFKKFSFSPRAPIDTSFSIYFRAPFRVGSFHRKKMLSTWNPLRVTGFPLRGVACRLGSSINKAAFQKKLQVTGQCQCTTGTHDHAQAQGSGPGLPHLFPLVLVGPLGPSRLCQCTPLSATSGAALPVATSSTPQEKDTEMDQVTSWAATTTIIATGCIPATLLIEALTRGLSRPGVKGPTGSIAVKGVS